MASAAASRPPAPPSPPPAQALQWLGPRVSFSMDEAGGGREAPGGGGGASSSADFEFFLGGCSAPSMLPADELFSGGKLVPLRTAAAEAPKQQPAPPRADGEAEKGVAAGGDEPKVPARRWRDLLRLRKQQGPADPLRRLLRREPKPPGPEPTLSLPLLRESDEKTSSPAPEATASAPPPTPPPPSQQHRLPPKVRLSPSQQQAVSSSTSSPPPPPPPPAAVAADSPRLNAAGKVVFNGLGRSSSSLAGGRRGHRGGIERSYSAHVRVAPVLNVCSLRGSRKSVSVFGIDRLFASPSSAANAAAAKKARANAAAATPQ